MWIGRDTHIHKRRIESGADPGAWLAQILAKLGKRIPANLPVRWYEVGGNGASWLE